MWCWYGNPHKNLTFCRGTCSCKRPKERALYVSHRLQRGGNTTDLDTLDTLDTFHVRRLQTETAGELQLEHFAFFAAADRSGLRLLGLTYGHNRFHHRFGAHSLLFIATF